MHGDKLGKGIVCFTLNNSGDNRGDSFHLPSSAFQFLGTVQEAHIATVTPDALRGNHYHSGKKECLIVLFQDKWVFAWNEGKGTPPDEKEFSGSGAVLIEINSEHSHAIKNTGNQMLTVIALSNKVSGSSADTFKNVILS